MWTTLIGRGGLMSDHRHAELGSLWPCALDLGQARPSYGRASGLRGGRALRCERDSARGNIFHFRTEGVLCTEEAR